MRVVKTAAGWLFQILIGVMFVMLGTGKFMDASWSTRFARWGFPAGFHMVVGVLEVLGGLALFVPMAASYGALLLAMVMLGAAATHVIYGETQRVMVPIVYMAITAAIAWFRRRSALRAPRAASPAATVV